MVSKVKNYDISWAQFETCNSHPQAAFERMCRWLFNDFFFDGKALLHADPNNPGVEVLPKLHTISGKYISFQAKYFSSIDYEQIKHSARKTVEYYSGKLDVVYLYCNKDVAVTSAGYQTVLDIFATGGIELIPVTNQEILEQVMKNETIAWYFFNHCFLSSSWFQDQLKTSLTLLGPRYNDQFHVPTQSEELFNYFLCSESAASRINRDKNDLIAKLRNNRWKYRNYQIGLEKIMLALDTLVDVSEENILDCLSWPDAIKIACADAFAQINQLIKSKELELAKIDAHKNRALAIEISEDINTLGYLLKVPELILPENYARILMRRQILVVKGNAGVGKSQMFAVAAEKLIQSGRSALLLLGMSYLNNHTVTAQTLEILSLDLSMEALLHKLEGQAIQNGTYSYIFIDGINESTHKDIWKTGVHHLFSKIAKYPHIKLAISIRTGYEKIVLTDAVNKMIADGDVDSIIHNGFRENSVNATLSFLDYYGIPFLPSYFLRSEMTNPLFLKLFCETYSGENFDAFSLFNKLIAKADREAQTTVEFADQVPILNNLVDELATIRLSKDSLVINQTDLFNLGFWDRFGLSTKKIPFVASLVRSGLLISMATEDAESYVFGYNLLEDFVCAKAILKKHHKKNELISYLQNELLKVEGGHIMNYLNIDIFVVVCGLFADRYHEECFDDIEKCITDELDREDIVEKYLESFMWRKASSVSADSFLAILRREPVNRNTVFRILIENSAKEHHPLNALFLHDLLLDMSISHRDALWTTFINSLAHKEERVFQLITYFDKGNLLNGLSHANTELLLILFSWLLTSSNRFLRDKASKAAIELLKHHFMLSKTLLQRFETVNDPYVIQRLYGIIFGACVKRTKPHEEIFKELAEYIYTNIFDQETVYPDILLRDYARLILERWKYEYPAEKDFLDISKIRPPYHSTAIPIVKKEDYYNSGADNDGFNSIDFSMKVNHKDCPGIYGDFGRYTFQAALQQFDGVDIVNMYHYAMQFIRDELGYDELLGQYDSSLRYYGRNDTKKIERIGKKYQWIAFYNILARISDVYLIKELGEEPYPFQGPWEPYLRDFDPTLNKNSIASVTAPSFNLLNVKDEFLPQEPTPHAEKIQCWKQTEPEFFSSIPSKLMVSDMDGVSWTVLYLHDSVRNKIYGHDTHSIGFTKGSQQIWLISEAYFVKPTQFDILRQHVASPEFSSQDFPEGKEVYQLFNREHVWSPGYRNIFQQPWIDYEIDSGEYRIEKDVYEVPDFEHAELDDEGNMTFPIIEKEFERKVPAEVLHVQIMPTLSRFLWEEQYDASQDETISFYIPCRSLIEHFDLEQKRADGYYYTKNGELVCFDSSLSGGHKGLLIRTDFLQKYLNDNNVKLIWTCVGEKQYFLGDLRQDWTRWHGCYHMESGNIVGKLEPELNS